MKVGEKGTIFAFGIRSIVCPKDSKIKDCSVLFANKFSSITQEAVTVDNDGMYVCIDCGHKTDRRGNWMKHRRKHLGKISSFAVGVSKLEHPLPIKNLSILFSMDNLISV